MCAFAPYDIANVDRQSATTWSPTGRRSRPIARPARRSAPSPSRACIDELAEQARSMDPIELRAQERRQARAPRPPTGRSIRSIGYDGDARRPRNGPSALQGAAQARTRAAAWPAASGSTSAANRAPSMSASTRTAPSCVIDRPSRHRRLARLDGHDGGRGARHRPRARCRVLIGDTSSVGFTDLTGGSRVTFATGMVVTQAAEKVIDDAAAARRQDLEDRSRGASTGRTARPVRPAPMPASSSRCRWPEIAAQRRPRPAGRSAPASRSTRTGAGAGFATHICDVEVDPRNRPRQGLALHGHPGCRQGDPSRAMSRARCRAASPRASAGR